MLHALQQGNARKSVLAFASKESVDLLIIGMYKPNTRRKGLAVRGNAVIVANRCAMQHQLGRGASPPASSQHLLLLLVPAGRWACSCTMLCVL
jgi:hypothetical protein